MSELHPIFAEILGAWQSAPQSRQLPQDRDSAAIEMSTENGGTALAIGRGMKQSLRPRCYVTEYLGNNRAIFECSAGHTFKTFMFKKAPNGKVPAEVLLEKFARYWSRGHAGVAMDCPRCKS